MKEKTKAEVNRLRYVSATDIGLVREENQDMVRVDDFYGRVLAIVCDGMGGERAGQDARVWSQTLIPSV